MASAPPLDYIRDGAAIYERSFAIIRAEADLSRFNGAAERVVVRMIHACGMTDLPRDIAHSPDFGAAGASALRGFYTSGLILHRPDEEASTRRIEIELTKAAA